MVAAVDEEVEEDGTGANGVDVEEPTMDGVF